MNEKTDSEVRAKENSLQENFDEKDENINLKNVKPLPINNIDNKNKVILDSRNFPIKDEDPNEKIVAVLIRYGEILVGKLHKKTSKCIHLEYAAYMTLQESPPQETKNEEGIELTNSERQFIVHFSMPVPAIVTIEELKRVYSKMILEHNQYLEVMEVNNSIAATWKNYRHSIKQIIKEAEEAKNKKVISKDELNKEEVKKEKTILKLEDDLNLSDEIKK